MIDLDRFHKLYPWEDEQLALGEPLEWLWPFDLSVSAEQFWPYLIDTSRLNRLAGYEAGLYTERNGMLHGVSQAGQHTIEWDEPPWVWNYARSLANLRLYQDGATVIV